MGGIVVGPNQIGGPFSAILNTPAVPPSSTPPSGYMSNAGAAAMLGGKFLEGLSRARVQSAAREELRQLKHLQLLENRAKSILADPEITPEGKANVMKLRDQVAASIVLERTKGAEGKKNPLLKALRGFAEIASGGKVIKGGQVTMDQLAELEDAAGPRASEVRRGIEGKVREWANIYGQGSGVYPNQEQLIEKFGPEIQKFGELGGDPKILLAPYRGRVDRSPTEQMQDSMLGIPGSAYELPYNPRTLGGVTAIPPGVAPAAVNQITGEPVSAIGVSGPSVFGPRPGEGDQRDYGVTPTPAAGSPQPAVAAGTSPPGTPGHTFEAVADYNATVGNPLSPKQMAYREAYQNKLFGLSSEKKLVNVMGPDGQLVSQGTLDKYGNVEIDDQQVPIGALREQGLYVSEEDPRAKSSDYAFEAVGPAGQLVRVPKIGAAVAEPVVGPDGKPLTRTQRQRAATVDPATRNDESALGSLTTGFRQAGNNFLRALGQRASTMEAFREDISPLASATLRMAARDLEAALPRFKTQEGYDRAVASFRAAGSSLLQETSNAVGDELNRITRAAEVATDNNKKNQLSDDITRYADSETRKLLATLESISGHFEPGQVGAMTENIVANTWNYREGALLSVAPRGEEKEPVEDFIFAFMKEKGRPPYMAEYAPQVEKGIVEFVDVGKFRSIVSRIQRPPGGDNPRQAEVDAAVRNFTPRK